MLYSLVNNNFERAKKELVGECPLCHKPMYPKCGDINVHHWAHGIKCIHETEPMTEWHLFWQDIADKRNFNVHFYEWKDHIPDAINLNTHTIYEFQNSPISEKEIVERCEYYKKLGFKTAWVFNYINKFEKEHLDLKQKEKTESRLGINELNIPEDVVCFKHSWQKKYIQSLFKWDSPYYGRVYFDIGNDVLDIKGYHSNGNGWGKLINKLDVL